MTCYFRGVPIEEADLPSKGMTSEDIEFITHEAYSNYCCEQMEELNAITPVIDFGIPEIKWYQMKMPILDTSGNKICIRIVDINYCPFCGKMLRRRLHPRTQTKMEDYE